MKILSKDVKIPKPEKISSQYVENALKSMGIDPLRWAVTAENAKELTVSVSYCD